MHQGLHVPIAGGYAKGRGYNRSLSYFHHHVDYWTGVYPQCEGAHCEGNIGYFESCLAAAPAALGIDPGGGVICAPPCVF